MNTNNTSETTTTVGQVSAGSPSEAGQVPSSATQVVKENLTLEQALAALEKARSDAGRYRSERNELRKTIDTAKQTQQQQQEQQLREQGKFEDLAKQYGARVQELEPYQQRYSTLASVISSQIDQEIKEWPDEVKKLVPDAKKPVEERFDMIQQLRPLVLKFVLQRAATPGSRPNPAAATQTPEQVQQSVLDDLRRTRGNLF